MTPSTSSRREFVSVCVSCAGALLAGCVALVTHPVPVSGGRVRLLLRDYPELSQPEGVVKIQPEGLPDPVYVLVAADGFRAVSPICTHRGCTVEVHGARLVCPCHGSTYDREGTVLKGPAQRALARYQVTATADAVEIVL